MLARLGRTSGHQIAGGFPHRWFEGGGDKWVWTTEGCSTEAHFDPAAFAERLRGGRLTYAGDSLAGQSFVSLLCLLMHRITANHTDNHSNESTYMLEPTSASFALDTGAAVQFVLSDFLTGGVSMAQALDAAYRANTTYAPATWMHMLTQDAEYHLSHSHGGSGLKTARSDQSWLGRLRSGRQSAHDVLVLSTGFHWAGALAWSKAQPSKILAVYHHMVNSVCAAIAASGYRGRVFYMTTYAPGCANRTTQPKPEANRSTLLPTDAPHGWGWVHYLDSFWPVVAARALPQLRVLNVSLLSSVRTDRHVGDLSLTGDDGRPIWDCLHFRLPGPPDVWNLVLQEAMKLEDMNDLRGKIRSDQVHFAGRTAG